MKYKFCKVDRYGWKRGIFYQKMDMVGNGVFSTEKYGYGWVWIWPNGVEWSGSQNFTL